jgi:hypothetical protein
VGIEVKIEDVRPMLAVDPARLGKKDTLVTYRIGIGRPRTVLLAKEAPTSTEVQAAIRAQESASTALIGQSFTL